MPNPASPRPPSLRSHGVGLFGSLLSPLRPPPSALAPAAPSGGAPILVFLALPCLLFACLKLPLLLADMRSFAFGKTAVALAVFPHAQSRIPPPALATVAWCRALRLASLATSPAPKRPCSRPPPAGAPRYYHIVGVNKMVLVRRNLPWEEKIFHGKKKVLHGKKKILHGKKKSSMGRKNLPW